MFVEAMVTHCDINEINYPQPVKGVAALAQSAAGRWCQVLWFGPEYVAENGVQALTYEQAVAQAEAIGGEIDF